MHVCIHTRKRSCKRFRVVRGIEEIEEEEEKEEGDGRVTNHPRAKTDTKHMEQCRASASAIPISVLCEPLLLLLLLLLYIYSCSFLYKRGERRGLLAKDYTQSVVAVRCLGLYTPFLTSSSLSRSFTLSLYRSRTTRENNAVARTVIVD